MTVLRNDRCLSTSCWVHCKRSTSLHVAEAGGDVSDEHFEQRTVQRR
jgi:hypothetical protein